MPAAASRPCPKERREPDTERCARRARFLIQAPEHRQTKRHALSCRLRSGQHQSWQQVGQSPYAEIVRLAAKIDADLIVIGTTVHASLFGGAPALGSEIERVVRNAPCPVLCVPSGKVVTPLPAFGRTSQPFPQT